MKRLLFAILPALLVTLGSALAADAWKISGDAKIAAEVLAVDKQFLAAKGEARGAMMAPDFTDVHASGWLYSKEETLEFSKNGTLLYPQARQEVIKDNQRDYQIRVLGPDVAVLTGMTETYYAVPSPQDVARANGAMMRRPEALAKIAADRNLPQNVHGAWEVERPNPYRSRFLRLWVRQNGKWLLEASQASRVQERTGG